MTTDMAESIIGAGEIIASIKLDKNRCSHYWVSGYITEPIIYCKNCNKEIQDVDGYGGYDLYRTHTCNDSGDLITLDEYYKSKKKIPFLTKLKRLFL